MASFEPYLAVVCGAQQAISAVVHRLEKVCRWPLEYKREETVVGEVSPSHEAAKLFLSYSCPSQDFTIRDLRGEADNTSDYRC